MRKLTRSLVAVLAVLAAAVVLEGLAALVFVVRPTGNPLAFRSGEARLHLYVPQETGIFYRIKPHHRQVFRSDEFRTEVRTNNLGFRDDADYRGEPLDVAVVGDSFTFGHGVDTGERYGDLLRAALPGRRVAVLSPANGWAPVTFYLYLKQHPELLPRLLVIGLFAWNDLADDMASAELQRDAAGRLVRVAHKGMAVNRDGYLVPRDMADWSEPGWRRLMRESHLGRLILLAADRGRRALATASSQAVEGPDNAPSDTASASAPMSRLMPHERGELDNTALQSLDFVGQVADLVSAAGGQTLVLYIPASYMVGDYPFFCSLSSGHDDQTCARMRHNDAPGEALRSWFARHPDILLLDPTDEFRRREAEGQRLYYEKDGHWTPLGHAAAAELLVQRLAEEGLPR